MNRHDVLLTLPEVAGQLGVTEAEVRDWRGRGAGPAGFRAGRRVVYRADEVDRWSAEAAREGYRAATRQMYQGDRDAVFSHYGRACQCCRSTDQPTIDHVNGGGGEHRAQIGRHIYQWLVASGFPEGYQTLCLPCNQSKRDGPACRLYHGDPGKQQCTGPCGQIKPLDQFNRRAASRNGYEHRCRDCRKARWTA